MDLQGIKNIIFDLGNVLLDVDTDKSKEAFKELGIQNFDSAYTLYNQNIMFDLLEIGRMNQLEFALQIREMFDIVVGEHDIVSAWNAMLGDFDEEKINCLVELKKKYKLFLLSNTNEIHYKSYISKFRRKFDYGFRDLFDHPFFSHEMGLRKPNERVYKALLHRAKIVPEETLYIDDNETFIEAGKKMGFRTYLFTKGEDLPALFKA